MLLQHVIGRHNLADTMLRQLALEEPDKDISGHGVEFDAAMTKEADLRHACAVSRQCGGTRRPISRCLDGLRIQPQLLDIGEPQSKVNNVNVTGSPFGPGLSALIIHLYVTQAIGFQRRDGRGVRRDHQRGGHR
jgi:hypothetical protein